MSAGELFEGLDPVVGPRPRALVLGTMPSVASIRRRQYYGNPRNLFWPFMQEILGIDAAAPYEQRLRALTACGLGLWDVARRCRRRGSADQSIRDVVCNDVGGLVAAHPTLQRLLLNGRKAHELLRRLDLPARLEVVVLPSTSPANAGIPVPEKLHMWRRWVTG